MTRLRAVLVLTLAVLAAAARVGPLRASQPATGQAGSQEVLFGTIQGTVTREGTSTGIPDVQISVGIGPQQARALLDAANRGVAGIPPEILQAARGAGSGSGGGGGARGGQAPPLSAVTDSAGRFTIHAPAGTVVVRAMLAGYFSAVPSGYSAFATAMTTVGSDVATVHFSLIPGGTINGRVTSPAGKPVANTAVGVVQQSYRNGVLTFDFVDGKGTDDRGEYRLFGLQPGNYYVVAAQRRPGFGPGGAVTGREVPVTTHSPLGRAVVDVQSDLENVSVVVHQGVDLKGRVLVNGVPGAVSIRLSLQPDDDTPNFLPMFDQISSFAPIIEADGSFLFPLVPEARYRLQTAISGSISPVPPPGARGVPSGAPPVAPLTTLPATAYVADVLQGGASVYDNGLPVGADPLDPIDVIVATDGIAVDGTVLGSDRKPVAGVLVALVPAANRRQNPALFQTARTNLLGRFSMTRVAPGAYTALAWDAIVPGAYQNPEFIQKYEARGVAVNARAGSAVTGLTLSVTAVAPAK